MSILIAYNRKFKVIRDYGKHKRLQVLYGEVTAYNTCVLINKGKDKSN